MREWAARHGTRFRSQTYGTPPVTLSSNALVDLAEGEGWQWRQFSNTRWASSANHLYKRAITSSETWTWLHSPVFRATPLDLKAEADLHFLEGVNQIIGHGWPYSPAGSGRAGMAFLRGGGSQSAQSVVDRDARRGRVSSARQLPAAAGRAGQRCRHLSANSTTPTRDFTPGHASVNQLMNELIGRDAIPQILDAGYNFDFIDDAAIARGGIPYQDFDSAGVERIPLATIRAIEKYVRPAEWLSRRDVSRRSRRG